MCDIQLIERENEFHDSDKNVKYDRIQFRRARTLDRVLKWTYLHYVIRQGLDIGHRRYVAWETLELSESSETFDEMTA